MVNVPLPGADGAYVRLRTQPLPALTDAQLRAPGPLQPAGSVARLPEIPNPDIALPSLEVNVMLSVCLAPTVTDIVPETEAVAITVSLLPVGPLPLLIGSPGGLFPPVPTTPPLVSIVPRLLL